MATRKPSADGPNDDTTGVLKRQTLCRYVPGKSSREERERFADEFRAANDPVTVVRELSAALDRMVDERGDSASLELLVARHEVMVLLSDIEAGRPLTPRHVLLALSLGRRIDQIDVQALDDVVRAGRRVVRAGEKGNATKRREAAERDRKIVARVRELQRAKTPDRRPQETAADEFHVSVRTVERALKRSDTRGV